MKGVAGHLHQSSHFTARKPWLTAKDMFHHSQAGASQTKSAVSRERPGGAKVGFVASRP
jgi:hypothetical protein